MDGLGCCRTPQALHFFAEILKILVSIGNCIENDLRRGFQNPKIPIDFGRVREVVVGREKPFALVLRVA